MNSQTRQVKLATILFLCLLLTLSSTKAYSDEASPAPQNQTEDSELSQEETIKQYEFFESVKEMRTSVDNLMRGLTEGNCDEAKRAMLAHLRVSKQYKDNENTLFHGRVYFGEKTLIYWRLGDIEAKQGNRGQAEVYRSIARASCLEAEWRDCSDMSIAWVVGYGNTTMAIRCLRE